MEYQDSEEYVVLHFKENVEHKFFTKENLFFKIVNLETKRPLIQIGNHVFQGKYCGDYIGTCLYFEEQENLRPPAVYERDSNIHLKFIAKTNKMLSLQWQKTPEETSNVEPAERAELEFTTTYENVLKQLESGSLDIEDIVKKPAPTEELSSSFNKVTVEDPRLDQKPIHSPTELMPEEFDNGELKNEMKISSSCEIKEQEVAAKPIVSNNEESNPPDRYTLLKDLIHKQLRDPEYYDSLESFSTFSNDREFKILKEIYLKSCNYKFDDNRFVMSQGAEKGRLLYDFIDVKASIAAGVVENKDTFNDEDCNKMLSMENFDNFTEFFKILVLRDYLKDEKRRMAKMSSLQLTTADDFGWTPKQRYAKIKSFLNDLKYNMFSGEVLSRKNQE